MKNAIVFGAGLSGHGAKELLEKKGYNVFLIDDKTGIKSEEGIKIIDEQKIEFIVKSPGIPWDAELLEKADSLRISVISEIDLAYRYMDKKTKIISITGTNGKTTTATKIYELLKEAGFDAELAGNAGFSFAKLVSDGKEPDYVVLELSSYQLENDPEVHSHIAGIINLTPDHLTRYNSLDDYYKTKFNIFDHQNENDYALINLDDKEILRIISENKDIDDKIKAKRIFLSGEKKADVFQKDGMINVTDHNSQLIPLMKTSELSLKGKHNLENILFIISVGMILNVDIEVMKSFLSSTKPLEHRLENFFEKGKTVFINDSKGTNSESTIKAIEAFGKSTVLICGGYDKQASNKELIDKIAEKVEFVYLIGQTSDILEKELKDQKYTQYKNLKTLENVLNDIKDNLDFSKEQVVLFSPATSSFDQFKNFEDRGRIFKELTNQIIGDR
ncbi:UDP-N-acetylmuramoylalanine--D-glutamate ligase [Sebaldella termitidis]|jgi:UDP-N-acetylmuramoylalanine--D-glutamate ligase|uniref:UDP-N-acetylmuramoylalanine--D-glutamate ligase n=1 Tax=Sebaldella termitidis (strain ATCC 33386 / NCTC 11300) TaxID=526218 RepID=D1AJY6_SEBTE|nr:UDP-N-acetylmuramoyl-L-alanine--D-glutamate ligase [Sebaldella termitidis]ACZ07043.1 UDP-N-acetylmuramoylalanine/D-glutamate ligase [Sebaldella termitidis ATCC 33386]SUI22333.1 UDP-N-acetylmuramoylalanine--D-glutamate ligase [Sebaldella termitidis]